MKGAEQCCLSTSDGVLSEVVGALHLCFGMSITTLRDCIRGCKGPESPCNIHTAPCSSGSLIVRPNLVGDLLVWGECTGMVRRKPKTLEKGCNEQK